MQDMQFVRRRVSRRKMLVTALAGICGLSAPAAVIPKTEAAARNESAEMNPAELINALRSIGKPVCVVAADRMAATKSGFNLHLRRAGLNEVDARD